MSHIQHRRRGNRLYAYRVTSVRTDGKVVTTTEYIGPVGRRPAHQELPPDVIRRAALELLRPGISTARLQALAKEYHLHFARGDPKVISLHHDRPRKRVTLRSR